MKIKVVLVPKKKMNKDTITIYCEMACRRIVFIFSLVQLNNREKLLLKQRLFHFMHLETHIGQDQMVPWHGIEQRQWVGHMQRKD